jgi:ADP-ribose pyrophosphatase
LTAEHSVLCERHYKHGAGRVTLTLPAGGVERGETPLQAAQRELREETGFISHDWRPLSVQITHANAGGSVFHTFLALCCYKEGEPASGDLEDIAIEEKSLNGLLAVVAGGRRCRRRNSAAGLSRTKSHPTAIVARLRECGLCHSFL